MNIYKSVEGGRAIEERYRKFLSHWPVPNQQLRIPTRQGETFVVASGPEGAPPLLLFHGSGANASMWMGDIAAWAAERRVYAVDMIGEPGLSAPSRPPLHSGAYALWLDDVLEGLSLTRVSLVGISLGGWLALDYATRRPARVESLALLCPGGVGKQKLGILLAAMLLQIFGERGRNRALQMALRPVPRTAASPAHKAFGDFAALIFRHFSPRRTRLPIFTDEALNRLAMPVLVIVGGRDAMLDSYETSRRVAKAVPHASICLLPELGHLLPGQTTRILEFLCGAGASAPPADFGPAPASNVPL